MGYKKTDPCLEKAFDDERIFVLLARDPTAPLVIAEWIKLNYGKQPPEKIKEAYEAAMEMMDRCTEFNQRKENAKKHRALVDKLAKKNLGGPIGHAQCYHPDPREENSAHGFTEGADVPTEMIDCDQCDGCGWYEGGPTLKTTCQTCNGKGKVRKPEPSNSAHSFTEGANVCPRCCTHPNCSCDDNICPV